MDHLPKMDNKIQTIFNEYQNFILRLDWVVEDIKKQYVSYKIDWENFVEIVPHKSLFKVMIDIPYKEIQNPADFIEDVEWKWFRWTWTTRILVRNIENFEYIKWLIKKSLIYNKEWDLD
jgi:predicted transport protein